MLWSPGDLAMPVTTTTTTSVTVRARALLCQGAPVLTARLDGTTLGAIEVTSTEFTEFNVGATTTPGSHQLTFTYDNDFADRTCDRSVSIDSVVISDACGVNQYRARYYNNTSLEGAPALTRCENAPGGSFTGSPAPGVDADNFSVDFEGTINFPTSDTYALSSTLGNVGARAWLDGTLVDDSWTAESWTTQRSTRFVTAGHHTVRAAYFSTTGDANYGFVAARESLGTNAGTGNYFAADSIWNTPLPATATVDPRSAGWVAQLDAAVDGVSMNSTDWTTTVYNAPAGTPTTDVAITNNGTSLTIPWQSWWSPTADSDGHIAIIDDATGCLYEFQSFDRDAMTAIASASYNVATGSGNHIAGPAHSGGETSYLAGMITPQDMDAGVIDHALRYAMPNNAPTFVYPGTRSDGSELDGVPEGTRMRLDPAIDVDDPALALTPAQRMVARALQTYGGFNADSSSSFALYARSTADGTSYSVPPEPLPDSLVSRMQFLTPEASSVPMFFDRADDTSCQ
ncbi:carbohydrate-binding domain-containing protein [Aeromicrobium wangtongii]|uniref:PA14 domain-containing protein n=2 Tax=Aeromicrobium wangtongii TaxID=2969247 RepID=A0ABY5MF91_9ACTN|nr:carbohydrate-binding domain-containing protein [Aeromicrobium wangtongii]UUP15417.1 PA14 domain-containing protein [Aeromicrobium wangtongii]